MGALGSLLPRMDLLPKSQIRDVRAGTFYECKMLFLDGRTCGRLLLREVAMIIST
jgi:hypothetical protein